MDRARAIRVTPTERTGPILPSFSTGHTAASNSHAPEFASTYMVRRHIVAKLILGTARLAIAGLGKGGHSLALPPTPALQYLFLSGRHVRPDVGAGIDYTIFYFEEASGPLQSAISGTRRRLSDSVGYAVQAGGDVDIGLRVFAKLDLKYLDIDTRARLTMGSLINRESAHLDPLVPGIGIGMRSLSCHSIGRWHMVADHPGSRACAIRSNARRTPCPHR